MKKWLTLVLVFFSTCAMAQSEVKMTPAQKQKLDTFFSNFSEADVLSFKQNALSDDAMLDFALQHNYKNKFKALKKSQDGLSVLVPAELVDNATIKYFGLKISKHAKHSYPVPMADGEVYTFSRIDRLVSIGNDRFQAEGTIYSTSSGGTPNPHGTPAEWKKQGEEVSRSGTFSAVIKAESERYILLEYAVK